MFLFAGFLHAALLWLAITLITRDKEGADYWECVPWIVASVVAKMLVWALGYAAGLPVVFIWVLGVLAGLGVLWFFVRRNYGSTKGNYIILAYLGISVLLALPRLFA